MKHLLPCLFLLLLAAPQTPACMNQIQGNRGINGIPDASEFPGQLHVRAVNAEMLKKYIADAQKDCGDKVKCSDLVIAYLYAGQMEEALELSTRLAAKHPRKYEVVMTHAAALELNGRFPEALAMLRKGVKLNPKSHKNSEWIHIRILEDRIKGGDHQQVLGLDFGDGELPVLPKDTNADMTLVQLHFQLAERISFIPKKDTQFASLLHDYADLLYLTNKQAASGRYYRLAAEYGHRGGRSPKVPEEPILINQPYRGG